MKVPKNSYACAICQKTFNDPDILVKHVEFRHSLEEQSPSSEIGPSPQEKDPVINGNLVLGLNYYTKQAQKGFRPTV